MPRNEELSLSSLGIQMPYNMQAEQSVLGAALMDETVLNRLITDMEPEMFYSDQNRAVYETMRSLYTESEAVDLITLVNALGNNGTFAGADDAKVYVTHLAETVPAISNVDSYLKIVREKYQARRLIEAARSILSETSSGEDADMLLESAEQKIYDIRSGRDKSGVKTIRESILEVIDTMQKLSGADRDKFAGIPTGLVSVPLRYMHTPTEVICLDDLDATVALFVQFARDLESGGSFVPMAGCGSVLLDACSARAAQGE